MVEGVIPPPVDVPPPPVPAPDADPAKAPETRDPAEVRAKKDAAGGFVQGLVTDKMSMVEYRVKQGGAAFGALSAGDQSLFVAAKLDRGFTQQELSDPEGITMPGGGLSITVETSGYTRPVKVLAIVDQQIAEGKNRLTGDPQQRAVSYSVMVEGEHDPVILKPTETDALRAAYLENNASLIAETFPPEDREMVTWGLRDVAGDNDIPQGVQQTLREHGEKEANPMYRARKLLDAQIEKLQIDIKATTDKKELEKAEKLLAELEIARLTANGKELGAWGVMKGLKALEAAGIDTNQLQGELKPEADKGQQLLDQRLADQKLSDDQKTALKDKGLQAILDDKKLAEKLFKIEGLKEMLFGDTPDSELGKLAEKFLTKEQLDKLKSEHGTSWWKIALLIAAGIIVAVPAGIGLAGVGVISQQMGQH